MPLALWTVVALLAAASAAFCPGRTGGGPRAPLRRAQRLPARRDFFGVFYWVLEPDLVRLVRHTRRGCRQFFLTAAIYYSFVTLTTLGYGDIVPRSEVGRGLAMLEAVVGQLYLAVMIARLVSLYAVGERKDNQRDAQDGPDGSAP